MKAKVSDAAAVAVRAWQRLVTAGLPAELRDRRREEISRISGRAGMNGAIRTDASHCSCCGAWRRVRRTTLRGGVRTVAVCCPCWRFAAVLVAGLAVGALELGMGGTDVPGPPEATACSPLGPNPLRHPSAWRSRRASVQQAYAQVSYRFEGTGQFPSYSGGPTAVSADPQGSECPWHGGRGGDLTSCGRVTGVRATKPSLLLTQAAVDAVQQWTFASAARDARWRRANVESRGLVRRLNQRRVDGRCRTG